MPEQARDDAREALREALRLVSARQSSNWGLYVEELERALEATSAFALADALALVADVALFVLHEEGGHDSADVLSLLEDRAFLMIEQSGGD